MKDSDELRAFIEQRLLALNIDHAVVSVRLGMKRGYMSDYFRKGSPKFLPNDKKIKLAEIIDVHPRLLGVPESALVRPRVVAGMAEDLVDYVPGPDSPIPPAHIAIKRVVNRALDQHPKRLVPGKAVAFNLRQADPKHIEPGSVVWVQLARRSDPLLHAGSVLRQFIPPDKLVTNSSEANDIMSLDDVARDLVAVIMGTMAYTIDDAPENGRENEVSTTKEEASQLNRNGQ